MERTRIELAAPILQGSVAPLEHASPVAPPFIPTLGGHLEPTGGVVVAGGL